MKSRNWIWRIFTALIATVMFISSMPTVTFAAMLSNDANDVMGLSVSSATCMPGETVQVTINVSNNPGIASLKFDVQYDSMLTLTAIEFNNAFGNMITAPEPYQSPQAITMISPLADINENGVFATLTFVIADNASDGYSAGINVIFDPEDIFDGDENKIDLNVENGRILVFHGIPGDIDGDKKVNTKDAIDLFRYVSGWSVAVDEDALDVNGDGSVNTKDAIALFRYVAGWQVEIVRPIKHIHSLAMFEATESTCTERGNTAYYFCDGCGKYYSDGAGNTEISWSDTRLELAEHSMTKTDFTPATCTSDGNLAYWTCTDCYGCFSDLAGSTQIDQANTVVPAFGHSLTKITESDATCTDDGNITYWHCNTCEKNYIEETAETEIATVDTIVSATGHALLHVEYKDATCTENGNFEYWYCSACECYFADGEAETEIVLSDTVIPATGHSENLQYHEKVDATVYDSGMEEYWECVECGKCYSDAGATAEVYSKNSLIIPAVPSYTIIFFDNKNWPNGNTVKFAQDELLIVDTFTPPEVLGYEFVGWSKNKQTAAYRHEEDIPNDIIIGYIPAGNTESFPLYAHWMLTEYNLTMRDLVNDTETIKFTIEDSFELANPTWRGLEFAYWYDPFDKLVIADDINGVSRAWLPVGTTGDTEIVAKWRSPANKVVNKTPSSLIGCKYDTESQLYWFVYEIGKIENFILSDAKTDGVNRMYHQGSATHVETVKTINITEETARAFAEKYSETVSKSDEWSAVKGWANELSLTSGISVKTGIGAEIGVDDYAKVTASIEHETSLELGVTENVTGSVSVNTGETITDEESHEVSNTFVYSYTYDYSTSKGYDLTSEDPVGYYSSVNAATVNVYAVIVYDPSTTTCYFDTYSTVSSTNELLLYERSNYVDYVNDSISYDISYSDITDYIESAYYIQYDTGDSNVKMPIYLASENEVVTVRSDFEKFGYSLWGWKYVDANGVEQQLILTPGQNTNVVNLAKRGQTITLYAHWVPIPYQTQWDTSIGCQIAVRRTTSPTGYGSIGMLSSGDNVYYGDVLEITYTSDDGYLLTEQGKEGITVSGDIGTDDIYAKTRPITYTVRLHSNDGSGAYVDMSLDYNAEANLTNSFTYDGNHEFLGWSYSIDAKTADFSNNALVKNLSKINGYTVNLYAVWLKTSSNITITKADRGGEDPKITDYHIGYYNEVYYPNLDRERLKENGYTKLKIKITFQGRDYAGQGLFGRDTSDDWNLAVMSYFDTEIHYVKFKDQQQTTWDPPRETEFVTSIDNVQTNGSFWIKWWGSGWGDDGDWDSWLLGNTWITVEAIK